MRNAQTPAPAKPPTVTFAMDDWRLRGNLSIKPGWYTCRLSVIDEASGAFGFPRFAVRVDQTRN